MAISDAHREAVPGADNVETRYIRRGELDARIRTFTRGLAVTTGHFERTIDGDARDVEWNQLDQLHRVHVHRTYQESLRLALGREYAASLTRWGKWPFFITVSDYRVNPGVYYQSLTLAGLFFLHSIISIVQDGSRVHFTDDWWLASSRWLRFLHRPLNRHLLALHNRQNDEDDLIRARRCELRAAGYRFSSDPPDFLSANTLTNNVVFPELHRPHSISIAELPEERLVKEAAGPIKLVLRRTGQEVSIWPAACPHEGGPLEEGSLCDGALACPWHGLRFAPLRLGPGRPRAERYGLVFAFDGRQLSVESAGSGASLARRQVS